MARNTAFLVARRRNEQRRHGDEFLNTFEKRTGIERNLIDLIEPAQSLTLEDSIYAHIADGLANGKISRQRHLSLPEALSVATEFISSLGLAEVNVLLLHSPDFLFRCRADVVVRALRPLIEWDGDTVTIAADENRAGVVLDVETETEPRLFEVDWWRLS